MLKRREHAEKRDNPASQVELLDAPSTTGPSHAAEKGESGWRISNNLPASTPSRTAGLLLRRCGKAVLDHAHEKRLMERRGGKGTKRAGV